MTQTQAIKLAIITPVYDDWECFITLADRIAQALKTAGVDWSIIAVDDGSNNRIPAEFVLFGSKVTVIRLNTNQGHQRAIAIGLAFVHEEINCDYVVVMDSDGEDRPESIVTLLQSAKRQPESIVFAERAERKEAAWFIASYAIYKIFFRILTGKRISFGNYSIISRRILSQLVNTSEIWNHYSGAVIKSRIPYCKIPLPRGNRYIGCSKMNLTTLILHGLAALSVHIEFIAVRLLIASVLLMVLAFASIVVAMAIRICTTWAIPGWASSMVMGLSLTIAQAFSASLLLIMLALNKRTQQQIIPVRDYRCYIQEVINR